MIILIRLLTVLVIIFQVSSGVPAAEQANDPPLSWKLYTNARFRFSVRYPQDWRLGEPMPDGLGITFYPPISKSQVALSGFLNTLEGTSQDGRQTMEEFAADHRRIITDLYEKKGVKVHWSTAQNTRLGGLPGKQLSFSYRDDTGTEIQEIHLFMPGRNEGRGVRIKFPASSKAQLMPLITQILASYRPGRDQNTISPVIPKDGMAP
ncbi:MAG: hypothetical protein C4293_10430 [Nitrospiraceae bacterium]